MRESVPHPFRDQNPIGCRLAFVAAFDVKKTSTHGPVADLVEVLWTGNGQCSHQFSPPKLWWSSVSHAVFPQCNQLNQQCGSLADYSNDLRVNQCMQVFDREMRFSFWVHFHAQTPIVLVSIRNPA